MICFVSRPQIPNMPIVASGGLLESPNSSASPKSESTPSQPSGGTPAPLPRSPHQYSSPAVPQSTTGDNWPSPGLHSQTYAGLQGDPLARMRATSLTPSPTPSKKKSRMLGGTLGRIFKRNPGGGMTIGPPQRTGLPGVNSMSPSLGIAYNPGDLAQRQQLQQHQQQRLAQQQQMQQFLRHKEMHQQHLYQLQGKQDSTGFGE